MLKVLMMQKKTLESKGYTFKSQKDVSGFGDIKVFEQAYDKDGMPIYGYVCEVDGSSYIVCAANAPSDWDVSNLSLIHISEPTRRS